MKKGTIILPTHKVEYDRKFNILTLIEDLSNMEDINNYNVVIVVNGLAGENLRAVTKAVDGKENFWIDAHAYPCGLSSAWNAGVDAARNLPDIGANLFFVNHDLSFSTGDNIFDKMTLAKDIFESKNQKNVFVFGVEGTYQSPPTRVQMISRFQRGQFGEVLPVSEVSGFLFGISVKDFVYARSVGCPLFDANLNPCFYEEMDICLLTRKLQEIEPEKGWINVIIPFMPYEHEFGLSTKDPITTFVSWFDKYTGTHHKEALCKISRNNKEYLQAKWGVYLG